MSGAGYSLNTASSVNTGPVHFGDVTSGTGNVVFGSASPGTTAAISNLTSNPLMLAIGAGVALTALFLYLKYGRK